MSRYDLNLENILAFILLISTNILICSGGITFPGCDRQGWKCIKSKFQSGKYDVEYNCPSYNISRVVFSLWNFRAPADIITLKIANCSYLELDLTCSSEGRSIHILYVYNIGILNITTLVHQDLLYVPNEVVFENIDQIYSIPSRAFKQQDYLTNLYKCNFGSAPIDKVLFKNIGLISSIQYNAFNLTSVKYFTFSNVTIGNIEPYALQLYMEPGKSFRILNSSIDSLEYKSISLRCYNVIFDSNTIRSIGSFAIHGSAFVFDFLNSHIGTMRSFAFELLVQSAKFFNNSFFHLYTHAFRSIGPGLLENSMMSFGMLKFSYNFTKNKIMLADVGSLNPDWTSYSNVRSTVNFTMNYLPCSCVEFGWITIQSGLGKDLSDVAAFNNKLLHKEAENLCIGAPCVLPIGIMSTMMISNGTCQKLTLKEACTKFLSDKNFRSRLYPEKSTVIYKGMPLSASLPNKLDIKLNMGGPLSEKITEYVNDEPDINLEMSEINKKLFKQNQSIDSTGLQINEKESNVGGTFANNFKFRPFYQTGYYPVVLVGEKTLADYSDMKEETKKPTPISDYVNYLFSTPAVPATTPMIENILNTFFKVKNKQKVDTLKMKLDNPFFTGSEETETYLGSNEAIALKNNKEKEKNRSKNLSYFNRNDSIEHDELYLMDGKDKTMATTTTSNNTNGTTTTEPNVTQTTISVQLT